MKILYCERNKSMKKGISKCNQFFRIHIFLVKSELFSIGGENAKFITQNVTFQNGGYFKTGCR